MGSAGPDLYEALQVPAEHGWSHVVVDGKLIRAKTTTSVKGHTLNA